MPRIKQLCEHSRWPWQCRGCGTEFMYMASSAKSRLKRFFKLCKLKPTEEILSAPGLSLFDSVPSKLLEKITSGNGEPDFEKECLEEKGPKIDVLTVEQWARAISEYRVGRKYRVAWRYTSIKRKVFSDVFKFYIWQRKQGEKSHAQD